MFANFAEYLIAMHVRVRTYVWTNKDKTYICSLYIRVCHLSSFLLY